MIAPEIGRIRLREPNVATLPYWVMTFAAQSAISIWTDRPQRQEVIAPGRMKLQAAVEWSRAKVPQSWMLVQVYRQGRM